MTYQQVRDILAHVQELRGCVQSMAKQREADSDSAVVSEFLERAEAHDEYMRRCLAGEADDAPEAVLKTWIQYPDIQSIDNELEALKPEKSDQHDTVVDMIMALDQRILQLYSTAKEQANSKRVQDFFDKLSLMESQKARAKSWGYTEDRDL